MAARKRIVGKSPAFRLPKLQAETEEQDLKKVKEQMLKELDEQAKNAQDWYDKEMDKNLKKS